MYSLIHPKSNMVWQVSKEFVVSEWPILSWSLETVKLTTCILRKCEKQANIFLTLQWDSLVLEKEGSSFFKSEFAKASLTQVRCELHIGVQLFCKASNQKEKKTLTGRKRKFLNRTTVEETLGARQYVQYQT